VHIKGTSKKAAAKQSPATPPVDLTSQVGSTSQQPQDYLQNLQRLAMHRAATQDSTTGSLEDTDVQNDTSPQTPETEQPASARFGSGQGSQQDLAAASDPATPSDTLTDYALHPDWKVRQAVADNPACPQLILGMLCADADQEVAGTADFRRRAGNQ
jgi:hypothetical protein